MFSKIVQFLCNELATITCSCFVLLLDKEMKKILQILCTSLLVCIHFFFVSMLLPITGEASGFELFSLYKLISIMVSFIFLFTCSVR